MRQLKESDEERRKGKKREKKGLGGKRMKMIRMGCASVVGEGPAPVWRIIYYYYPFACCNQLKRNCLVCQQSAWLQPKHLITTLGWGVLA